MTSRRQHTRGFDDLAADSQAVFRAVLEAMSRPGRRIANPVACRPPPPLTPTSAAVALALVDHDVSFWLDQSLDVPAVAEFLRFHTSAKACATPGDADFALVGRADAMPRMDAFNCGSLLHPERSTTVIVQTAALDGGSPVHLIGPGIERRATIAPDGLSAGFWEDWTENRRRFPLGIDIVMTDDRHLLALPRTCERVGS
jgi:alpha-D-ribose 1-methylphosphonate 5-triphosphate synthase subunit PhnH